MCNSVIAKCDARVYLVCTLLGILFFLRSLNSKFSSGMYTGHVAKFDAHVFDLNVMIEEIK